MPEVERQRLTPLFIQGLRKRSERYTVYDTAVPSLAVRVTETGHKSFILAARFPPGRTFTRRRLGDVEGQRGMPLAEARRQAREWLVKIGKGIDPKEELRCQEAAREAERMAALRAKRTTFVAVAEDFIAIVLG